MSFPPVSSTTLNNFEIYGIPLDFDQIGDDVLLEDIEALYPHSHPLADSVHEQNTLFPIGKDGLPIGEYEIVQDERLSFLSPDNPKKLFVIISVKKKPIKV